MLQGKLAQLRQCVVNHKLWVLGWRRVIPSGVLFLCLGLLVCKVYSIWGELRGFNWEIRYAWFLPLFGLFLIQTLVVVWGWRSILGRQARRVPFRKHLKVYCYTTIARRIPAGLLWQVAGRAYWYRQLDVSASISTAASVLELGCVILAGLPIGILQMGAIASLGSGHVWLAAGLSVVIIAALIQPKLLNQIYHIFKCERLEMPLSYRDPLKWVGIYGLVWLLSGTALYVNVNLFHTLPLQTLPEMIGVWTLTSLVSYLTLLTPSGFGVKELSLTLLLEFYLPEPLPLIVALSTRVMWTVYEIVAGIISLVL